MSLLDGFKTPELLSPAGDMISLKSAVKYGADAVYLGGVRFGMRAAPKNFTQDELFSAVEYCHQNGVKVYLACNVLPRNTDFDSLPEYLTAAKNSGVDALIVSDLGVLEYAKRYAPGVELHASTQMGVVNFAAAKSLYSMGVRRIVTARELSLEEISRIRREIPTDMDIECFVHGAMCVSFSSRCLISNYLASRDSNLGACAQPCRWKYSLVEETRPGEYMPVFEDGGTYILNSKDMCMIEHIPDLVKAGVNSFKIEGRAKSEYYVSVITNAYRAAIDGFLKNPDSDYYPEQWIIDEVKKVSYRDYCTGFFYGDPSNEANVTLKGGYNRRWEVCAVVDKWENGIAYCTQRNRFFAGDELEAMQKGRQPLKIVVTDPKDENGQEIQSVNRAMMNFSFICPVELEKGTILRRNIPAGEKDVKNG